ncbi:hypothetical protein CPT_Percy27 [Caulobacter phage Percy]|uniref:Uncharacterized protein n=1 Tax=Caulobacter phage Percy TaxID=1701809 RepID=A0A0M5M5N0_9CAUD|nr:hypothetical protein CPT_Percy27 [Caulobacter phage Percy]ALF01661.1 hypothetical protein CPT_Percy27 [Caulobacter phage Percy]
MASCADCRWCNEFIGGPHCAPCVDDVTRPNFRLKDPWVGQMVSTKYRDNVTQRPETAQSPGASVSQDNLTNVLAERGNRYGQFKDQAVYADGMNKLFQTSPNWETMDPDQREALRLIANKIGRILNGDPNYDDSWVDIAGYSKLIANRLQGNPQ